MTQMTRIFADFYFLFIFQAQAVSIGDQKEIRRNYE